MIDNDDNSSSNVNQADQATNSSHGNSDDINAEKDEGAPALNGDPPSGSSVPHREKYPCTLCTKEFSHKSGRYNHIKIHHKVKLEFGNVHCLENGCLFSCTYTTILQRHLSSAHNIPMNYLSLEFENYAAFERWKHDFETGEVCRFVKKSGSRVHEKGKTMYLYCSRSGNFVSHSTGRRMKKLGSSKISAHCTALIKYYEESSGCVKATVCTTHYGHDRDHRFLRLTKNQKEHIADCMKSGMSRELVLDSLHSTFVNKLDRIHELSKKDLNNIQTSFKIPRTNERRKSQSTVVGGFPVDLISDLWTSEIDTGVDSPVLFLKELGSTEGALTSKDKCLILMTKGQKDLFLKFCNNSVLYVTILRVSVLLPLFLTVVFILDDFYETFPVCFMISTSKRLEVIKVLFDKILFTIGPIVVRALATDDSKLVNEAWCEVMGPTENLIIANRHVDSAWRCNLTVVEDEACQGEVYDKLYDFIENSEGTKEKLTDLIKELRSSVVTSEFGQYLEKHYLDNIESWSTCYLKANYDLREPIDFELSYSKIATLCDLCSKYTKRVNYCAKGLIKLLLEFQSNRNRKVAESVLEINSAHEQSVAHSTENVFPLTNGLWKVPSFGGDGDQQMYEVREAVCNFNDCVLTCAHCEACVHMYYCACDSYVDGKTCVHVHLVGSMMKKLRNHLTSSEMNKEFSQFGNFAEPLINEQDVDMVQDTNPEIRSRKLETLKVLKEIGSVLLAETSEKRLDSLDSLIRDVHSNVNMLINYSNHAQKIVFSKTGKPVKKKTKNIVKKKTNPIRKCTQTAKDRKKQS